MSCLADEDRDEIQAETHKQEEAFDHIGAALGDLKHMSHVSICSLPKERSHVLLSAAAFLQSIAVHGI